MNLQKTVQNKHLHWCQWFAGLVDADGCLLLNAKNYSCLEITMGIHDEYALQQIKKKLGGSVKLRTKAKAYRYRLHNKMGMLKALAFLNGHIRNSIRLSQLKKLCNHYNILFIEPSLLTLDNAWFSGFFDGDGTLSFSFKKGWPQLVVSVSNKKAIDCLFFQELFGGSISLDKRCNTHKWQLFKKTDIVFFCNYLKKHSLKSIKKKRIRLTSTFFQLRSLRAYTYSQTSLQYKSWVLFEKQWFDNSS
uniref:Putative LAGLIDADG homing endonuclease n=1 Tax=Hazenia capsulata TaxID=2202518 RepID=A0A1W6EHP7_9CHLO|nr:putative LAGLIDADG homing endonuclease [Hazenia capsulata]ARK14903.1 putative LAGLIDADG homing endonuclease [Hazenia capsulata]